MKFVFLVGFLLPAELLYGNPLQNAPQEKELVTHGALKELGIAERSRKDRQNMFLFYCFHEEKEVRLRNGAMVKVKGTDECEKVLKCYERCNPACSRNQMALDECNWPVLYDNDDGCVRNCGKDTGIECDWEMYDVCIRRAISKYYSTCRLDDHVCSTIRQCHKECEKPGNYLRDYDFDCIVACGKRAEMVWPCHYGEMFKTKCSCNYCPGGPRGWMHEQSNADRQDQNRQQNQRQHEAEQDQ